MFVLFLLLAIAATKGSAALLAFSSQTSKMPGADELVRIDAKGVRFSLWYG